MVNLNTYLEVVVSLLPAYSALTCGTLLIYSIRDSLTEKERKIKYVSSLYMIVSFLIWVFIFLYGYIPEIFIYVGALAILTFLLVPVFFYRVIRLFTRMEDKEEFSPLHYLPPALIAGTVFIWSFFVPLNVQVDIIKGLESVIPKGFESYAHFYLSASLFRAISSVVYNTFTLIILHRYYRMASLVSNTKHKPANWIVLLMAVSLILLVNSFVAYFVPHFQAYTSPWFLLSALLIMTQQTILTWHIIRCKYLLYIVSTPPEKKTEEQKEEKTFRFHQGKIDHQILESYFRKEKPYLNKNFKLSDLVDALDVNRTVISSFINQTYGVNFNRYLNRWRLKEFKRLQKLPANNNKSIYYLQQKAGFTNNKHYLRTIRAEDKTTNGIDNKQIL